MCVVLNMFHFEIEYPCYFARKYEENLEINSQILLIWYWYWNISFRDQCHIKTSNGSTYMTTFGKHLKTFMISN